MTVMLMAAAQEAAAGLAAIEEAVGSPAHQWEGNCHAISLAVLRTGMFGEGRVARGTAKHVASQHSWIILGDDVYDPKATVVDPTIQVSRGKDPLIWVGKNMNLHRPHGTGNIWAFGRPPEPTEAIIRLNAQNDGTLSRQAQSFLDMCGPLDIRGWMALANSPVQGWPAAEIINAMCDSGLEAYVPIDIVGMITDRNPRGLYR